MLKDFVPEDKRAEQRSGKLVRKIKKNKIKNVRKMKVAEKRRAGNKGKERLKKRRAWVGVSVSNFPTRSSSEHE